jgi:hypothetical protein
MSLAPAPYTACPRCAHAPLPQDQSLPAACPGCGVILAKIGARPVRAPKDKLEIQDQTGLHAFWLQVPDVVDAWHWRARIALLAGFAWWTLSLVAMDPRTGEIGRSFLHAPLLVFHEAGHVIFWPFGEWMTIFGGSLFESLMPLIMAGALLRTNRDPFGASLATWLFGVSLLGTAAYVYDALEPQLILLGGNTGADGPHDWIYLLETMGMLSHSQRLGLAVHAAGVVVMLAALGWGACVLWLQRKRVVQRG